MVDLLKKNTKRSNARTHNAAMKKEVLLSKNRNMFANVKSVLSGATELLSSEEISQLLGIIIESSGIEFPMKDGRLVTFDLITVAADDIDKKTYIAENNDREQAALNHESLEDILSTLSVSGNFLPGVANVDSDGNFSVLDGSRRRKSCKIKSVPYRLYVPREQVTESDAKWIADIVLLQKALSYREKGLAHIKIMERRGFKEIQELVIHLKGADYSHNDYELIRIQVNAARISFDLISLVPDFNSLTVRDYKLLIKIDDSLSSAGDLATFVAKCKESLEQESQLNDMPLKARQKATIAKLETLYKEFNKNASKAVSKPENLLNLSGSHYVKTQNKGRRTDIQLRVPDKDRDAILEQIKKLLSHLEV